MKTYFSFHSRQRMSQRGLGQHLVQMVIRYGEVIHKQGLKFYFVTRKMIQANTDLEQAADLMVVVSGASGAVLTTYRNPRAIRRVKKKPKRLAIY
ncbi:MAG: DUF4258 domain-containing protein [Schleiferiaceae bacterium]|nr:DUF4258 domain-containing protein [Schleiferiaceae bacterium]